MNTNKAYKGPASNDKIKARKMMTTNFLYGISSVVIVSFISLIGAITLTFNEKTLQRILLYLVSFSAGALFADALLHMLPEAAEELGFGTSMALYVLLGIILSFIIEKFIQWRHCHLGHSRNHPHPFAYMNLIGDAVHNFIDGIIIIGSYLISIPVGFATTLAVIFHEIPQEIGDIGVMLHGGFTKKKALLFNFLSACTAIVGGVVGFFLANRIPGFTAALLPITAGHFIYIAGTDLLPELHKEVRAEKSLLQLVSILLGIGVMAALLLFE